MDIRENFYAKLEQIREEQLDEKLTDIKGKKSRLRGAEERSKERDKHNGRLERLRGAKERSKERENVNEDELNDKGEGERKPAQTYKHKTSGKEISSVKHPGKGWSDEQIKKYSDDHIQKDWKTRTVKEEQLNELSSKKARKAEHKAAGRYYNDYDDETAARRKAINSKSSETIKGAEDAKSKREKSAKRVIRFQNYADKK